ncbi:MAG: hypothetical protein KF893_21340 [Caldilineaceae bacterium]|nr:hypothetical protein [Caldilineaceae bacterium]
MYNPAIVCFRDSLLMAYRVDSGHHKTMQRRIGLCELDARLNVVSGSVRSLSDTIQGGDPRHYDPRFLVYHDRLFVHYNNNFLTRPNQIHLVELDPDTLEARSPARLLHLDGPRQEIEKNWMLFEHEGDLLAVYRIAPHTILRVDLAGQGAITCSPLHSTDWDVAAYAGRFGSPCGGAPPVRQGDTYVSFFHSRYPINPLRWVLRYWPVPPGTKLPRYLAALERRLRRPFAQVRYVAGAYAFEAAPPFRPLWITSEPVLRPEDEPLRRYRRRANPSADGIIYPCGALPWPDQRWLVSYGVNDEACCLRWVHMPAGATS